jgi:SAM-dependent methyltransferase
VARHGRSDAGGVFGPGYAGIYDEMYAEKDYRAECDIIEEAFHRFSDSKVQTIIDFGCGTGGHSIPLAERGYDVVGVDLSAPMLDVARAKGRQDGIAVRFHQGDVRVIDIGRRFDAGLLMFAVLGYQQTNADVAAALANVRRHLSLGGLLVFDVWYGPSVLTTSPSNRARIVQTAKGPLRRSATAELDVRHHICRVRYQLQELGPGGQASDESHVMRYFFPLELEHYLEEASFKLVSLTPVGTLEGEPTLETWNVLCIARAA